MMSKPKTALLNIQKKYGFTPSEATTKAAEEEQRAENISLRNQQKELFSGTSAMTGLSALQQKYGFDSGGTYSPQLRAERGISTWGTDTDAFLRQYSDGLTSRDGVYQSLDSYTAYRDSADREISALLDRSASYRDYFTNNRDLYDGADVDAVLAALDEGDEYLNRARTGLQSEYDYWAQFEDETAYNTFIQGQSYADLVNAEDFAEKSQYVTTANGEKKINWLATMLTGEGGGIVYDNPGYDDLLYDWINGNEEAGAIIRNNDAEMYGAGSGALGRVWAYATEGEQQAKQMTDEEIGIFNYLYATQGKDAAYNYYYFMQNELNYRNRQADEEYWAY